MAYGLPVEGTDGPFLGGRLSAPTTCDVGITVGEGRKVLEESGAESVVVLADGLAVGEFEAETLHGHPDSDPLLAVMDPVPTTVRPSVTVASVTGSGGGRNLVTTSDGRLLGEATVEADDHDGHDHDGHDHEDGDQAEEFDRELTRVMDAIEERFGDREPSEAELRSFLHDRLVAEGRSVEDADRFLDQLEAGGGD